MRGDLPRRFRGQLYRNRCYSVHNHFLYTAHAKQVAAQRIQAATIALPDTREGHPRGPFLRALTIARASHPNAIGARYIIALFAICGENFWTYGFLDGRVVGRSIIFGLLNFLFGSDT